MREKLREIRNKEEGFTLVELLAVIVILGIIMAIAVPSVGSIVTNSRIDATIAEEELVEDAARIYFASNEENSKETSVDVKTLKADGFLDVRTSEKIKDTRKVDRDIATGKITIEDKTVKTK